MHLCYLPSAHCKEISQNHVVILSSQELSTKEFLIALRECLPVDLDDIALINAWNRLIGAEIDGMAQAINEMKRMALTPVFFSNISELHYNYVCSKLSFLHLVGGAVLSYEVGDVKPNVAIYEKMEMCYCENRVPALYLDDRPENIDAARKRGWNAYQVGTVKGICLQLEKLRNT